jgi:hypothetical protein
VKLAPRAPPFFALVVTVLFFGVVVASERTARAAGPYEGSWNLSPISETFTVQEWSSSCGPAPVSRTMIHGGLVTVRAENAELVISGPRTLRTDQCLDTMPTLVRNAHAQDARSWRTKCSTPPTDSRQAVVNTAYFIAPGDDSISIAETGRYEFTINDAHCVADVKRAGSLNRVLSVPVPSAALSTVRTVPVVAPPQNIPTPLSEPPARIDCSSPREPSRLEVRPSRKLLRVGEPFAFRAKVLDASGCPTTTSIQWTVGPVSFKPGQAHAGIPSIDASGKLSLPSQDFADATFDVVATAAGRSARATVQVTSPADYDALLAQSGLDANGERSEPSVAMLATSAIGGADARAEDTAGRRRLLFIGIVSGLAMLLGAVAYVGARRAKRARQAQRAAEERHSDKMREYERVKRERETQHAAQMKAHLESVAVAQQQAAAATARGVESGPMFCPSCRRELPQGLTHCPYDSNRLVVVAGHEMLMSGPAGGVCPTCKRGYNPGVKVCPSDGDELVPAVVAGVSAAASSQPPRGKICPTCGGRFDGAARFCGKDGTQLVLVN